VWSLLIDTATEPVTRRRRGIDVFAIIAVLLVILLVVYISASDGIDFIHGFGKACLLIHDGWHMHIQCGDVCPPHQ